jgi:ectoine hydroxylase-related dioxygenase (phytanoyl-CoA dioxygenase family)
MHRVSTAERIMNSSANVARVAGELEKEGFHVFRNFLDRELVEKARQEISEWLETDIRERAESGSPKPWHSGSAGTSILTSPTHILLDAYCKSPTLDQLVEKILSDPLSGGVLSELAGEHIKFRGYNIQRMTGTPDPRPSLGASPNPHEWHRDSPGEFGIALFLEDVPGPNNGATSLVPGSHYFPYCPRWNNLFGPPYLTRHGAGLSWFLRFNLFNRLLARTVVNKTATGAYGRQGDFYVFINDVWHGREPNTEGRTGIKVMIGAYPSDDPFPDRVIPPADAVLAKLPPLLRRAAGQYPAPASASTSGTILKRLRLQRSQQRPGLLFRLALLERKFADLASLMILGPYRRLRTTAAYFLARLHRKEMSATTELS